MTKSRRSVIARIAEIAAFTGALAIAATSLQAAETKIKVGRLTSASGFHVPSYVAMDKGFFKREGLDATWVSMTGKGLLNAGMAGAIDFVPIPGGGSQALLKGAQLRFVAGQSLISQWAIVVKPDITSVKQLKGKTIGYGRPGSADYDEGEITLGEYFDMNVGRDYNVISFQGEAERLAALINGSIEGALLSFPNAAQAAVRGFKILVKTGEYLPRVGGSFWVTKDYLDKNRATVKKFIRAIAKAEQYIANDKAGTVETIQKHFGIADKKQAEIIWTTVHNQYGPDLPASLVRKLFDGRVTRMKSKGLWPKDKPSPDPEQFVERQLINETLREMGYYMQAPPAVQGKAAN